MVEGGAITGGKSGIGDLSVEYLSDDKKYMYKTPKKYQSIDEVIVDSGIKRIRSAFTGIIQTEQMLNNVKDFEEGMSTHNKILKDLINDVKELKWVMIDMYE